MALNPYERIDALEREVRHLATQVLLLATSVGHQAVTIAGLLKSLGVESLDEVAEVAEVSGEAPAAPSASRSGRKAH